MQAPLLHEYSSGEHVRVLLESQLASSSLSSQSCCLSHLHLSGMHFPLLHLKIGIIGDSHGITIEILKFT